MLRLDHAPVQDLLTSYLVVRLRCVISSTAYHTRLRMICAVSQQLRKTIDPRDQCLRTWYRTRSNLVCDNTDQACIDEGVPPAGVCSGLRVHFLGIVRRLDRHATGILRSALGINVCGLLPRRL